MELFLARHAHVWTNPPALPEPDRVLFPDRHPFDACLSLRGLAQAERLGAFLAGQHFDAVYTSPLLRAVETTRGALAQTDAPPPVKLWRALVEAGAESFPPMPEQALQAFLPGCSLLDAPDYIGDLPCSGEDMARRAASVRDWILEHHGGDDRVLVVSHGTFLFHYLVSACLGIPQEYADRVRFYAENASLTRIRVWEDGKRSLVFNSRTDYLGETVSRDMMEDFS